MLQPDDKIGLFRIEERAGSGATSTVYRAVNLVTGQKRALKVIETPAESDLRSTRDAARLRHQNIAAPIEAFEHEGKLIQVSEWMESSLEERLRRGPLSEGELLDLAISIASALDHAHQAGVVHRDIKPSNVLFSRNRYVLADFGAADRLRDTGLTAAGTIVGTPLYMSPEQVTGREQSPATDVFGFGLLLFRCAFGSLPGETTSTFEVLRSRATEQIDVPPGPLSSLIRECLNLDPALRPVPLLPAVAEAAQSQHFTAMPPPRSDAPAAPAPPPAAEYTRTMGGAGRVLRSSDVPTVRATAPRHRSWPLAIGLAAVALAAVVVIVGLSGRGGSATHSSNSPPGKGTPSDPAAPANGPSARWVSIGISSAILVSGLGAALAFRRRVSRPALAAQQRATDILFGARDRGALTNTLRIEVDSVVAQLRGLDARVIGVSVMAMANEYEQSKSSSDRQTALMNVVTLMERLQQHLDPWHVRNKDLVATLIAVTSALAAVAQAVAAFK